MAKGGKREGAGRKPKGLGTREAIQRAKEAIETHAFESIDYTVNGALHKKERLILLLDKLYELAIKGDSVAIKEYFNRSLGLPRQQMELMGGGNPLEVRIIAPKEGILGN